MGIDNYMFKYRGGIGGSKEDLDSANQTGMYIHGVGLYNSNGWHGILVVFSTPSYTCKVDINMSNSGWSIKLWDGFNETWV